MTFRLSRPSLLTLGAALALALPVIAAPAVMAADSGPKPFLSVPFSYAEREKLTISEGWKYTEEEKAVHGYATHYAVDFAAPRGTPIYAATSGYAISSFHIAYAGEHEGKKVGFGLGRFVQIWNPQQKVYVSYSHLDGVGAGIPYIAPKKGKTAEGLVTYDPTIVYQPLAEVMKVAKFVRKGQLVGYVGDTGLSWGYQENLTKRDVKKYPSWDETHLHFEVYRRSAGGSKAERYDPFGFYAAAEVYQSWGQAVGGLWLKTPTGGLRWARK